MVCKICVDDPESSSLMSIRLFLINENYRILSKLSFFVIFLTCPTNHSMHLEINKKKILVHIFCLRRDHIS